MSFVLSQHAEEELQRRAIPRAVVEDIMNQPQQIVLEHGGRKAYQSYQLALITSGYGTRDAIAPRVGPWGSGSECHELVSLVDFSDGRFLVRVIVDDATQPAVVVTVYRTSKVRKYWSAP